MEVEAILGELIGMTSVVGGLTVGCYAIFEGAKDRRQRLEAISKERLLLIEKGMDPALAFQKPNANNTGARALFWGLLLSGLGFGLLIGFALTRTLGLQNDEVTQSSALLFGGLGIVIYYLYNRKNSAPKGV